MSVFAVPGLREIRVEIQIGRVDIVATDRGDVVVTVSPSNPSRSGDRSAAEGVQIDRVGGTVRVIGPFRLNLFGSGDSVDVLIEVPVATSATVDVKYGSVNASGHLDTCRLNVPYGDITLDRANRLDLSVGQGEVRVGYVAGDAEVRLKSGSARLGHIDGALRLNGSNASVVVDSVGSSADISTSSGAVELGRTGGNVGVRSAYGVVRLAELARGSARIEGSYGGVDIGVRRGTAVWLDAVSQHGVVRTDLAAGTAPAEDDEKLELYIRSGYGDIAVRRSTLPPAD
jgi:hypothetical protein